MWATALCGVLAAMATGIRYYVDRRVSELASAKRAVEIEQKDAAQRDREAQLQAKVDAAEIAQKEADLKLSKVEAGAAPRNLDAGQRQRFIEAICSGLQSKRAGLAFSASYSSDYLQLTKGAGSRYLQTTLRSVARARNPSAPAHAICN